MSPVLGDHEKRIIAEKTLVVHDEGMAIDRQIIAGQAVPPDLVEVYENEVGGSKRSSRKAADSGDAAAE